MAAVILIFLVPAVLLLPISLAQESDQPAAPSLNLSVDYYRETCPQFETIIQKVITDKQIEFPTTAAGTLRLFFHDCVVGGCDASLLVSSDPKNTAQRDADINLSLPGDAFDVVTRAKTAIELQCPGIVSCADILALATRDLVAMVGGPVYPILLGRKDGLVSHAIDVEGHIARPNMSMTRIIGLFEEKGLSVREMVALMGGHTIGFSHCSEFSDRIFKYSSTSEIDPTMNPGYAKGLRKLCADYKNNQEMAAFNDVITPGRFDNMYYRNLKKGLGLLISDQVMVSDPRTMTFVDVFAANQTAFFEEFSLAMQKVSLFSIKTGNGGEVRRRCDAFNGDYANTAL